MKILDFILNGAETKRFHTWPVLREQSVGAHSFGVAMLCALMAQDEVVPGLGVPLLMSALTHDLAEHKVGDIPAPAKRGMNEYFPNFRGEWGQMERALLSEAGLWWEDLLDERSRVILKLADAMDGALYCIRERMMGNKLIAVVFGNFRRYIGEQEIEGVATEIVDYIDEMWEQANGSE